MIRKATHWLYLFIPPLFPFLVNHICNLKNLSKIWELPHKQFRKELWANTSLEEPNQWEDKQVENLCTFRKTNFQLKWKNLECLMKIKMEKRALKMLLNLMKRKNKLRSLKLLKKKISLTFAISVNQMKKIVMKKFLKILQRLKNLKKRIKTFKILPSQLEKKKMLTQF